MFLPIDHCVYPGVRPHFVNIHNVIVMVGLPARGKTYIARKLCRYLNWGGICAKGLSVLFPLFVFHKKWFFEDWCFVLLLNLFRCKLLVCFSNGFYAFCPYLLSVLCFLKRRSCLKTCGCCKYMLRLCLCLCFSCQCWSIQKRSSRSWYYTWIF